jgi:hypothetical protein
VLEEGLHPLVDLLTQPVDLALGDAAKESLLFDPGSLRPSEALPNLHAF